VPSFYAHALLGRAARFSTLPHPALEPAIRVLPRRSGDLAKLVVVAAAYYAAGADVVAVADTVGYAGPKQVGELTAAVVRIAGKQPVCVHLHDTRGMGIANASAALDAGARILDGSLGGLGGCPFAPGATGNVVFEDLVFLCESKGFATGIDVEKLVAVRSILRDEMPSEALYGGLARAGLPAERRAPGRERH